MGGLFLPGRLNPTLPRGRGGDSETPVLSLQRGESGKCTDKPHWGAGTDSSSVEALSLLEQSLFNKSILTLESRDTYPAEAEMLGFCIQPGE